MPRGILRQDLRPPGPRRISFRNGDAAARTGPTYVPDAPDFERSDRIGEFRGYPEIRAFAELLIDFEENRTLRAVLVGMLRENDC